MGPRSVLFILALLTSGAMAEPTCPSPSQIKEKMDLWSHGTCLRGANLWQKMVEPEYDGNSLGNGPVGPPAKPEDYQKLAAWGANYLNLSVPGIFGVEPPYTVLSDAVLNLDQMIAQATAANLFVVISFRTGPGRNEAGFDPNQKARAIHDIWKNPAAQEAWIEMWRTTALRYRNQKNVVGYELMVEPNVNEAVLRIFDPAEFDAKYTGTIYDWNRLASQITQAIRTVDYQTPILWGGLNYSDTTWIRQVRPTLDPKTVYLVHNYEPLVYTHHMKTTPSPAYPGKMDAEGDGRMVTVDKAWLADRFRSVTDFKTKNEAPVAINEFGCVRWATNAEAFLSDSMNLFESLGLNHAYWVWDPEFPIGWDEFNLRHGANHNHHQDVPTSPVIETIKANWSRNTLRPRNVNFTP